ncbi:MAG: hypothetical protein D6729_00485 [Deltaproteobacteria bacterium]|nr:MAG: hypothetical protein D6729_00485 [Deltaproteobacteria bacterium]
MKQVTWLLALAGLCLGAVACPSNGGGAVGSKEDAFAGGDIKADCFDCDPNDLRSAFEQADLGRTGFYRRGTTWTVAFQFRTDHRNEMNALRGPDTIVEGGDAGDTYLFEYRVASLGTRVFGDYKRPTATIEIQQAASAGPLAGLVAEDRLDRYTYQMDLIMNDLFQGVAKVYYDARYPHGHYVELGEGARVRSAADPFPVFVPDVTVAAPETRSLPPLSPSLEAIAVKAAEVGWLPADWKTAEYRYFEFDLEGGTEAVYWRKGDLWPSFVTSWQGDALLVRQVEP